MEMFYAYMTCTGVGLVCMISLVCCVSNASRYLILSYSECTASEANKKYKRIIHISYACMTVLVVSRHTYGIVSNIRILLCATWNVLPWMDFLLNIHIFMPIGCNYFPLVSAMYRSMGNGNIIY